MALSWQNKSESDIIKNDQIEINIKEDDLESSSSEKSEHVFQDPVVAEHYRELYEKTQYECRDHFDPDFTWTKEEETKVTWKSDWYVTFWAFFMFTALDFDRGNLQQALSDNMLDDLGMTTNQLNLGKTINLICFLSAELPSQMISKKIGADIWIPTQMVLWSVVSMSQFAMKNVTGYYATRALLGALQGGFICDVCLWMSYFYTSKELPFRLSVFYIANPLTVVWSSLLAFALLKVQTPSNPEGWKWLFLIEGVFTLLVGIISYFKMPASAVQTKTWYRKKGWYTDREEKIIVNKILRDDPEKGSMHNREPVGYKELLIALFDVNLLPIYIVRILTDIGTAPVSNYLQLVLRGMGFSTFKTNALTIPYNIISIFTMLFIGYFSEVFNSRALMLLFSSVWVVVCLIALRYWPQAQVNIYATFGLLTVLLSHPVGAALTISWCSANSNGVRSRAVSAAVVNIFSQAASIIAANIYRMDDAPLYHRGNVDLIGIAFGAIAACALTRFYYIYVNKKRDEKWNALSTEEKEDYIKNTKDDGNKRLDFRFTY
ncbi:putative permease [Scheffersomyces xylosifermentans]|uniref:putative permease n=1 Tax=Scheffersomyces xylosifermentans TaxID=1304137 RepID=UPI00315C8FAA